MFRLQRTGTRIEENVKPCRGKNVSLGTMIVIEIVSSCSMNSQENVDS